MIIISLNISFYFSKALGIFMTFQETKAFHLKYFWLEINNKRITSVVVNGWAMTNENCLAQRRRQMNLGTYLQYEKSFLGCGLCAGLDCETNGLGRL